MGCTTSDQIRETKQPTTKRSFTSREITQEIFVSLKEGSIYDYYNIKSQLGEGAFGSVKLVEHKKSKILRAMKQIKKSSLLKEDMETLFSEMDILKVIDHPNIVKVHELYQDHSYYYLLTDFCEGGELFDKLTQMQSFTEKMAASIMKQLLSAIVYCHERNIVHRDLKLENILFETKKADSNLKVIDFGTSKKVKDGEKLKLRIGTLYYMAPEVFKGDYDLKCDVWSAGVILYILLCGYPPFNGDEQQIRRGINQGHFQFPEQEWGNISTEAKQLIRKMLAYKADLRITAEQALGDPWIQSKAPNLPINGCVLRNLNSFYCNSKLRNAIEVFIITQATTYKEKEELMKQFQAMDSNGDGTLSEKELLECYRKMHGPDQAQSIVKEIMAEVDTNNSGKIDFTEFLVAATNKEKMNSATKVQQVFKMFDKNGDGKISRAELQGIMAGIEIDDKGWLEILDECDSDKDGEISLEELIELMKKFK